MALWIVGIEYALPIGIRSGLLVGTPVSFNQFDGILGLADVGIAFAIGQMVEGMILTPWLVGNPMGLHPAVVILAPLIFGNWFGYFAILMALPASTAGLVALRRLRTHYFNSDLYKS